MRKTKQEVGLGEFLYEEQVDTDSWNLINQEDIWVFDKLVISRLSGHLCGPAGLSVPAPENYIVRPVINTFGMGYMSRIEFLENSTDHIHPGEFWCEIFQGRHFSIDYEYGKQILAVRGHKHEFHPLQRFVKWEKSGIEIPLPHFLRNAARRNIFINCEFIEDKLIEVHFRRNPDFRWGNTLMIPKWSDEDAPKYTDGMTYIADPPGYSEMREGVFIS